MQRGAAGAAVMHKTSQSSAPTYLGFLMTFCFVLTRLFCMRDSTIHWFMCTFVTAAQSGSGGGGS